jgi:hypothetical protein
MSKCFMRDTRTPLTHAIGKQAGLNDPIFATAKRWPLSDDPENSSAFISTAMQDASIWWGTRFREI